MHVIFCCHAVVRCSLFFKKMAEIVLFKVCCCHLYISASPCCTVNTVTWMHPLKAAGPYHSREWCSSINLSPCRSSDTVFSFSGVSTLCSVTPVTTHPFCEVTIIILIIVHNDSRQEPERHDGTVLGASWYNRWKCVPSRVAQREKTTPSWPTKPLTGWRLYNTTLSHKAKVTYFN